MGEWNIDSEMLSEEPVGIIWMRDCDLAMWYGMEVVRSVIICQTFYRQYVILTSF